MTGDNGRREYEAEIDRRARRQWIGWIIGLVAIAIVIAVFILTAHGPGPSGAPAPTSTPGAAAVPGR